MECSLFSLLQQLFSRNYFPLVLWTLVWSFWCLSSWPLRRFLLMWSPVGYGIFTRGHWIKKIPDRLLLFLQSFKTEKFHKMNRILFRIVGDPFLWMKNIWGGGSFYVSILRTLLCGFCVCTFSVTVYDLCSSLTQIVFQINFVDGILSCMSRYFAIYMPKYLAG